jgi:hypothetical protein
MKRSPVAPPVAPVRNSWLRGALALASFAALGGCDAQQPPGYEGDPDYAITGSVTDETTDHHPPPARILVNWGVVGAMFAPVTEWSSETDLTGTFPQSFKLSFFGAPPAQTLFTADKDFPMGYYDPATEPSIALGHILAVDRESSAPNGYLEPDVLGGAESFAVVYAGADIKEGTAAAALLHGPLPAGYHLLKIVRTTPEAYSVIAHCQAAATGATPADVIVAWKACGLSSPLYPAAASETATVRLVDHYADLDLIPLLPVYLTPGSSFDPPPVTCNSMLDPMCVQ